MAGNDEGKDESFDAGRASLFEALSHPNRLKILDALGEREMSFAEIKREVGIESSGHLSFHLSKLSDLTKTTPGGKYALSDDGREALRVAHAIDQSGGAAWRSAGGASGYLARRRLYPITILTVTLLIAVVAISILAGISYQQNLALQTRMDQLNNQITSDNTKIADLNLAILRLANEVAIWKALANRFNSTTILRDFTVTEPPRAYGTAVAAFEARYGGYVWINGTSTPAWEVGIGYHSSLTNVTYEFYTDLRSGMTLFTIPRASEMSPHIVTIYVRNYSIYNQTATIDVTYFFMPVAGQPAL